MVAAKRIGHLTSGGDRAGLNAAIRAARTRAQRAADGAAAQRGHPA